MQNQSFARNEARLTRLREIRDSMPNTHADKVPHIGTEYVDYDMACKYLVCDIYELRYAADVAMTMANKIKDGSLSEAEHPIVFDSKGVLIGGMERLTAIYSSRIGVQSIVVRNAQWNNDPKEYSAFVTYWVSQPGR